MKATSEVIYFQAKGYQKGVVKTQRFCEGINLLVDGVHISEYDRRL